MLTEKHEADWYKMRSITQQNDLDGAPHVSDLFREGMGRKYRY